MAYKETVAPLESLEAFLSPVKPADFLSEFYCRAPLYIPGDTDKFSHLLSWDALNRATTFQRKNSPALRLAKDGNVLSQQQFSTRDVSSNGESWSIDFRTVRRLLEAGATLLVDRIDQTHEPLADLCRMLETGLGTRAFVDAFASWQRTQGFPTHWDPEEVFVAQLVGTKRWRVLKPERLHPLRKHQELQETPPTQPYWEGDMNPGDLLYIPGGWWHDAMAVSARTLHISASLFPPTGLNMLKDVFRELQENELARTPLPRFASALEQQDYMSRLRNAIDEKMRGLNVKSYLDNLDSKALGRTRLSLPWSAISELEAIPERAWIHWLPPRPVTVTEAGAEATIEALGEQFTFASVALPVVRDLISRRKLHFGEICSRHSQLPVETIVLELVSTGLVAIADSSVI